jgi:hypothetical protein
MPCRACRRFPVGWSVLAACGYIVVGGVRISLQKQQKSGDGIVRHRVFSIPMHGSFALLSYARVSRFEYQATAASSCHYFFFVKR